MSRLPTGTVTFLFTDIEGSTALLQQLPDAYGTAMMECRRLVRAAVQERGGQEVGTQGDAVFAAFASAHEALLAAIAAQRAVLRHPWPDGAVVKVRMGLHTGEARVEEGDYVGLDVHRAARVCVAAHGGQILLSDTTAALVTKDLPDGMSLRDLGEHRLKDLTHPHRLFQALASDLPTGFPPLRSLDVHPHNLPIQLTSFIGRENEITEVKRLLSAARLVTLTGSGGAGKTRLALQVAADVLDRNPDGVWLVEFAPIADPAFVPKTVASALNVPEQPGRALAETLVDALRPKQLLIVLDNCEHLLVACQDLTAMLLRMCPNVRILATSREGLGVPGETLWRVPSLSLLEDLRHLPAPEELVLYDAVRLFADRAMAIAPGFRITKDNAPAVAQVCQRLDGIPLAIELAAARVKVLAVEQIAARLDDRFHLLTGGSRTTLPRQQTLRGAVDWSYDLLSQNERTVLRRLSVFAGGWTLDAAEVVCSGDGVEAADILDILTQLVDKSLVIGDVQKGEARYRMLETVREYGLMRLGKAEEADQVRRRHRDWYFALAERAEPEMHAPNQLVWLERMEQEHDNMRAALEWSLTGTDTAPALRLSAALHDFWDIHNHFAEGLAWLDRVLSLPGAVAPAPRAKALLAAAHLAHRQGDYARVTACCDEALTLSERERDKSGSAEALHFLAHAAEGAGDRVRAGRLLERAVVLHRAAGSTWKLARTINCLANTARHGGDYPKATTLYEEALTLLRVHGELDMTGQTLHNLAYSELRQGDRGRARALFCQTLTAAEERGNRRTALKCLAGLAAASAEANPGWAVRLFGAADALLAAAGYPLEPFNRHDIDHYTAVAKGRIGEVDFNAAWAEGRAMTLDQAIEYALAGEG